MKKLFLLLSIIFIAQIGITQFSAFAEFAATPLNTEYDQKVISNLSLGLDYKFSHKTSLRLGISSLDFRDGGSKQAFVDVFIPGIVATFDTCPLNHRFDLASSSVFAGLSHKMGKWTFAGDFHRVFARITDGRIELTESSFVNPDPNILAFDADYESISFNRMSVQIEREMLNFENGSLALLLKYTTDFFDSRDALKVKYFDPELLDFINTIPGSNPMTVSDFLEGGNLNYSENALFFGVKLSFNLNKRS